MDPALLRRIEQVWVARLGPASARLLPGDVAHIGVTTHSGQRERGFGRAVVTAALAHALGESHLAQYQTLLANRGAMSIARAVSSTTAPRASPGDAAGTRSSTM